MNVRVAETFPSGSTKVAPGTWRLLAPALTVWAFAAWSIGVPGSSSWTLKIILGCVLMCGIAWMFEGIRPYLNWILRAFGVTVALLVLVAARIDTAEWVRGAPDFDTPTSSLSVTLNGFPNPLEQEGQSRYWVLGLAESTRGAVPIVMWGDGTAPPDWAPGTSIEVEGSLRAQAASDPSAFSLALTNITQTQPPNTYERVITTLRNGLHQTSQNIVGAELVPGFAVGDSSLVDDRLDAAMKASSLTHLIAVSGANCALIVGATMWLLSWIGVGRRGRILGAAATLGAFVLLIGPDASIQRAAIMASVTLISGFGGRRSVAFPSLGVAIILLLIADPWQSRHPGFTLSVAATAGILLWVPTIDSWAHTRFRVPRVVSLPFAVTVAAQIACGPLLLLLQPGLPVGGVLANILAGPAAPFGTGIGLIAMLMIPLHEGAGHVITEIASLPARWVAEIAFAVEQLPFSRWHWPGGTTGALLLTAMQGSLIWAFFISRSRRRAPWKDWEPAPARIRYSLWILSALGIGLLLAVSITTPVVHRAITPNNWMVVACDVGQGDAILIRDPEDPQLVMLIDTGQDPTLLRECLRMFGVKSIDLIVLTHDDRDHIGALSSVINESRSALISPPVDTDVGPRFLVDQLSEAQVPHVVGQSGMSGGLGPESNVKWEIFAPSSTQTITDSNGASLVMLITVGDIRILTLGDTGREDHAALLASREDLKADILKVAHHGSRDQDARLLSVVSASYGVISVGADNRYGHPSQEVLDHLTQTGTVPLRTDELGSIALTYSDGEIAVWGSR